MTQAASEKEDSEVIEMEPAAALNEDKKVEEPAAETGPPEGPETYLHVAADYGDYEYLEDILKIDESSPFVLAVDGESKRSPLQYAMGRCKKFEPYYSLFRNS